ncbi:MAG: methionyl-tRNA formyltransferase [Lachnospiraceae bacterium]|nr:methionyl-tRNA formyltransferase [Lachnospiraceae bacterium]
MRIVYMGTPEIAAVVLERLLESEHEVIAVVTQPDKPKGRGKEMACSDVKKVALAHELPIYQPEKARDEAFVEQMRALAPDLIVVTAFGQILPKALLELPKFGCINVHASLLPKYRGASPIQWAIINGDKVTGVTIMHMAEGIDTGDMITKELVEIAPDETGGSLHDKLAVAGGSALMTAIAQLENGTAVRIPQEESEPTYVGMLKKEKGQLDFSHPAVVLERLVRGLNPWPSTYTAFNGKLLKIWRADVIEELPQPLAKKVREQVLRPGSIVNVEKEYFDILTGEGLLRIRELQLEGKRRMTAEEFLRGYEVTEGLLLG